VVIVIVASIAVLVSLPLLVLACHFVWRLPWLGAALAAIVLVHAARIVPQACVVTRFCTPRLDLAVFAVVLGVGLLLGAFALAGFVRIGRERMISRQARIPRAWIYDQSR
jgi:hypothetical protein